MQLLLTCNGPESGQGGAALANTQVKLRLDGDRVTEICGHELVSVSTIYHC